MTIFKRPGVNCGKMANFKADKFDFVISTCALWGKDPSWKDTLKTGFHTLKPDGALLVAEFKKRFNPEVASILDDAGVTYSNGKWKASLEIKQKFKEEFYAIVCTIEDYNPEDF